MDLADARVVEQPLKASEGAALRAGVAPARAREERAEQRGGLRGALRGRRVEEQHQQRPERGEGDARIQQWLSEGGVRIQRGSREGHVRVEWGRLRV